MANQWYFRNKTLELGPHSEEEMRQFFQQGQITPDTPVRQGKVGIWVRASQAKGLLAVCSSPARASAATAQSPALRAVDPSPSPAAAPAGRAAAMQRNQPDAGQRTNMPPASPVEYAARAPRAAPKPRSKATMAVVAAGLGIALLATTAWLLDLPGRMCALMAVTTTTPNDVSNESGATPPVSNTGSVPTVPVANPTVPPKLKTLSTEEIVAQSEASVAMIRGSHSSGTGFLVQPKIVATNKHVVASELIDSLKIHFPSASGKDQGPLPATLLYEDENLDLAILRVETNLKPLPIAQNYHFRRGQELVVIGSPGFNGSVLQNAVSKGVMSAETMIDKLPYYQMNIAINPGNSGGPVFDSEGQIVGVVTLKAVKQEGMAFCIPLAQLRDTVDQVPGLSKANIETTQSKHRIRVVFVSLNKIGVLYRLGMMEYLKAMIGALEQKESVNEGLAKVKDKVTDLLSACNEHLLGDLKGEVSKIGSDTNLPEHLRQKFVELWTNYQELKGYVERPRGNLDSFKAKYTELADKHDSLSESLKLLLGVNLEDEE